MLTNQLYIQQCLDLAIKGLGKVAPNPMVGCIIVYNGEIIGKGYHHEYGKAHAEVNAIDDVSDKSILSKSTLYVNLEPCSHHGKTPPCSDLIIQYKIPHVVIGTMDSNSLVSGKGIEKLQNSGCKVEVGVLEHECKQLNKRFFTFHEKKRPYIILKWAQTQDKFIDQIRSGAEKPLKITSPETDKLVHEWRSHEMGILVGANTAVLDNPQLTVRHIVGKNPIRILIDKELKTPANNRIFDNSAKTLVFTSCLKNNTANIEYIHLEIKNNTIDQVLQTLYIKNITSVLVEGGTKTINSFIENNLWDEARVISGNLQIGDGVKAPQLNKVPVEQTTLAKETIAFYYNTL